VRLTESGDALEIPGYQLLEKIGEGGMGAVFRARQVSLDRTVAIKVLNDTAEIGERGQEPRIMACLSHSNVVNVYDGGTVSGRLYIVMEFVQGSTLRDRMQPRNSSPLTEVLNIVNRIAHALTFIHSRQFLHLDLKPENVLIDETGEIKITDFGLAQRLGSNLDTTQGTIDYCPPEQRFGLGVDQRTDLFALASIAYELITGRTPTRVYTPCHRLGVKVPRRLDRILEQGLARDPEDRPTTIEEFRHEFEAAIAQGIPNSLWSSICVLMVALLVAAPLVAQRLQQQFQPGRPASLIQPPTISAP
jgi:serine/threonine-protein kinase